MTALPRPEGFPARLGARFALDAQLGGGGQGVVWRAHDRHLDRPVALKLVHDPSPDAVAQIKREFRIARRLRHPHLVRVHELFVDGMAAWFTMDLVDGHPVDRAALDATGALDLCLGLARGLAHLHAAGLVHRDIKPGNVLCDEAGRVVLVDLGLAMVAREPGRGVAGSGETMAPEVLRGRPATHASDVFSLGIVLHRWLLGEPAPEASLAWRLGAAAPVDPAARQRLPDGLRALLDGCLEPSPAARPTAAQVVAALASSAGVAPGDHALPPSLHALPWIARPGAFAVLRAACDSPHGRIVDVVGPAGIGKTRLVETFLAQECSGARVLRGRCRPEETVPYNAWDAVVDALRAAPVDPALARELASVFAVFGADSTPPGRGASRAGRRRRAFRALRALLVDHAARGPLVLWIDDGQWADADSRAGLALLADGGWPAGVVLIHTRRPGDAHLLDAWPAEHVESLALGPLDRADAAEAGVGGEDLEPLVLAAHQVWGDPSRGVEPLEALVARQRAAMADVPRDVLDAIALSGAPVPLDVLDGLGPGPRVVRDAVDALAWTGLVTEEASGGGMAAAVSHDRYREILADALPHPRRVALHRTLASAWAAVRSPDAERVAGHHLGAGDARAAVPWLESAAERAWEALAFDRAADLYGTIVRVADQEPGRREKAAVAWARALVEAGRVREAATAWIAAAEASAGRRRAVYEAEAAGQLAAIGETQDARRLVRDAFSRLGVRLERDGVPLLAGLGLGEVRARWALTRRPSPVAGEASLARYLTDAASAVSTSLVLSEMMLAARVQQLHVVHALTLADPARRAQCLAIEAAFRATQGPATRATCDALLAEAEALVAPDADAAVHAFLHLQRAAVAWSHFRWEDTATQARHALDTLRAGCPLRTFVASFATVLELDAMLWLGRIDALSGRVAVLERDAVRAGDVYLQRMLACRFAGAVALARGDRSAAEAAGQAMAGWPVREAMDIPRLVQVHQQVDTALHAGDGRAAWSLVRAGWPHTRRANLHLSTPHRIKLRDLRLRAALADGSPAALRDAARWSSRLASESGAVGPALGALATARTLPQRERAARMLDAAGLPLHAHVGWWAVACAGGTPPEGAGSPWLIDRGVSDLPGQARVLGVRP